MKDNGIQYNWDEHTFTATCIIEYKGMQFKGEAHCHPIDQDLGSKYTGLSIAEYRAQIAYLRFVKHFEIEPELKALKQLYFSMVHGKRFNPKSYEAISLQRHIRNHENDLQSVNELITQNKQNLKAYLIEKDIFYKDTRRYRENGQIIAKHQEEKVSNNERT